MRLRLAFARYSRLPACILALVALAPAAASAGAPYRASLIPPPPAIVDALAPRESAPADTLIAPPPPVVAWLTAKRRPALQASGGFDVAEALLGDDQRAVAAALAEWTALPGAGVKAVERRRQRAAIAQAYAARAFLPFWSEAGRWNDAASAATRRLRDAVDDGLDLGAMPIPLADAGAAGVSDELALSDAVVTYAAQAAGARIDPQRLSHLIGSETHAPEPSGVLAKVAAAGAGAGDALQAYNPPHYGYQALRAKLAELRSQHGLVDVGAAREASAETASDDGPPRGRRRTAAHLSPPRVEAEIIANMERWRWLPRDMGENRVEVNIPDFELAVVRGGQVAHRTRVIVGKEGTPTPIFSNAMREIIVNPSWYVPKSIVEKEMLPKGGVGTLEGRGFKVSYRHGQLVVRQPPGEGNALGRIKFVFPNDFAVYMHDTPSRGLFSAAHRAFSHGCMRVEAPFALAEAVLGPDSGWTESRVKKLIGGSERYINLTKPLPVHIEYFTAYVDEAGRLVQRPDLYRYSARVRRELGLGG